MLETIHISGELYDLLISDLFPSSLVTTTNVNYGFDYIAISDTDPTKLSGMAVNLGNTRWPNPDCRQAQGTFLKPGKFLKAIYPNKDNNQISLMGEALARNLASNGAQAMGDLKVSDLPSDIYGMEHAERGSIGGSCLRGCDEEICEIFDISPSTRILYVTSCGTLIGRALLHDVVYLEDGSEIKFMDRIYSNNTNLEAVFQRWAVENGYHYKKRQSSDYKRDIVSPEGGDRCVNMSIPIVDKKYSAAPYMDTFFWLQEGALLSTREAGYIDCLNDTDGYTERGYLIRERIGECVHCQNQVYSDEKYLKYSYTVVCEAHMHLYEVCESCKKIGLSGSMALVTVAGEEMKLCNNCKRSLTVCVDCGETVMGRNISIAKDSEGVVYKMCHTCVGTTAKYCYDHGIYHLEDECPVCVSDKEDLEELSLLMVEVQDKVGNNLELIVGKRDVEFRIGRRLYGASSRDNEIIIVSRYGHNRSFIKEDPQLVDKMVGYINSAFARLEPPAESILAEVPALRTERVLQHQEATAAEIFERYEPCEITGTTRRREISNIHGDVIAYDITPSV